MLIDDHPIAAGRSRSSLIPPSSWAIGLAAVVAVGIRWFWLSRQAWYVDEVLDLNNAQQSFAQIIREGDGFPPLANLIVKTWSEIFSPDSARFVALVFGMMAWCAVVDTARRLGGVRAGVTAAWIAAISPAMIWYSQELRPHSLALALTAIALWAMVVLLEQPSRWRSAILGAVLAAGIATQYYFLAVAGAIAVVVLWRVRPVRLALRNVWPVVVLPAVMCVTLMPALWGDLELQEEQAGRAISVDGVLWSLFGTVSGYSLGPSLRRLWTIPSSDALIEALPWLILVAALSGVVVLCLWRGAVDGVGNLVWFTVLTTVAILIMVAVGGTGLRVRYLASVTPAIVVLVSLALSRPGRLARAGIAVYVVIAAVAIFNRNYVDDYRSPAIDQALVHIEQSNRSTAVVGIFDSPQALVARRHSDRAEIHPIAFFVNNEQEAEDLVSEMSEMSDGLGYWVIYLVPAQTDPNAALRSALIEGAGATLEGSYPFVELFWIAGSGPEAGQN